MIINGDKIMQGATQSPANSFLFCGALTAATTTAVGGVLKLKNLTGVDILVTDVVMQITTASTGAATIDVGVDDAGDTSNDTLIDGMNAQTVKAQNNRSQAGTNGGMAVWKNGKYIVATASATTAGMVGKYKIAGIAN
jgi:hypothetical protein